MISALKIIRMAALVLVISWEKILFKLCMRVTKGTGMGGQIVSEYGLKVQKVSVGGEIKLKFNEIEVLRMFRGEETSKDV